MHASRFLVLVVSGGLTAGCSTLLHGPTQQVRIESDPPGAQATIMPQLSQRGPGFLIEGDLTVTTPAEIQLRRDTSYRVEFEHEGYKLATTKVRSEYDFVNSPLACGACEAIGALPRPDMSGKPLPLRFLSAFYTSPVGAIGAIGGALRMFSPEALMGNSFKLKAADDGYFDQFSGLGTPVVRQGLERAD